MSADQDTSRCRILREGFLDVKFPPDSPERILHKAWRKLWVCAAVYYPSSRGEPHLILQFTRKADDEQPEKRLKASRDGLRLFRCKSGSRGLRTWGLSSGSSLLIYLADDTEDDTQDWMHAVREGLWPAISASQTLVGGSHEVSLIDDEKSFASGLLGVYGRMVKNSEDAICVIHPHWHGTQMRWRVEDILDVRLVRKTGKDEESDAGVFNLTVKSNKKDGRILQFYCKTASTTVDWIRSILDPNNQLSVDTIQANPTPHSTEETIEVKTILDTTLEYGKVNKLKEAEPMQEEYQESNASKNVYGKVQPKGLRLSNIPGHFLDASMSSPSIMRSGQMKTSTPASAGDSGEDSPGELYDHIYEEMNSQKDSRSDTVYEEVGDPDDDYVPPMPPTLPTRQHSAIVKKPEAPSSPKPNPDAATLRLQKLSESLSEALKQVEAGSQQKDTVERRRKLPRRVSSKKSKSLHHSPTLEVKDPPAVSSEKPAHVPRAVSVPEFSVLGAEMPLRPFHPLADVKVLPKKNPPEKTHEPLNDLLKTLEVEKDLSTTTQREVRTQVDLMSRDFVNPVKSSQNQPSEGREETEVEYIDMR